MFFNPNIRPREEYLRRLNENKRVCAELGVPFIEGDYVPELWQLATKGLEDEPEKGRRCDVCFYLRLKTGAEYAKAHGFTRISSVFGISRFKDFDQVFGAGLTCIIGRGDSGKSTILDAINYTFSSSWGIHFNDSDFYNCLLII